MTDLSEPLLEEERPWTQRTFSQLTPNGVRSSIVNFSSSTLGAGMLSLPYAMAACGVGNGCILLLLVGVCYYVFYSWLVLASEKVRRFTYVGVLEASFGSIGKHIMEGVVLIDALGTLIIMNALLCKFGISSLQELGVATESTQATRAAFLFAVVTFMQLPLALPEKIQSLRFASILSIVCVLYVTLVVVAQSPAYIAQSDTPIEYFRWDLKALDAVGIIFFAFSNPLMIPLIYDELDYRSPKRMDKVLRRSFSLLGLLYFTMGVLGYLSYSDHMPDIVTQRNSLNGGVDYPMLLGRTVYLITITMQVPYCLYPGRLAAQQLIAGTDFQPSALRYYLLTFMFLVLPMAMAIAIPEVIFYFKIMGSVTAVLMGIVFPILVSWTFIPSSPYKYAMLAVAAGLCGLAIACTSTLIIPFL